MSELTLIMPPNEEPLTIDDYKNQNNFMYKGMQLALGFDGIKLGNWGSENTGLPYILEGSVLEFLGLLFEAKENIYLTDTCSTSVTTRYIYFNLDTQNINSIDDIKLSVVVASGDFPPYFPEWRGFYFAQSIYIRKYLRISMSYQKETNKYWAKRYWDKDDVNREYGNSSNGGDSSGGGLKSYNELITTPGTHSFAYPMDAESITIIIAGAGAGGGGFNSSHGTNGGLSKITVGGVDLLTCNGGKAGQGSISGGIVGSFGGDGGEGGTGTGRDIIDKGGNGNNGCRRTDGLASNGMGGTNGLTYGNGGNGIYLHWSSSIESGKYGGGGGAGAIGKIEILRSQLGSATHIIIVVGKGGAAGSKGTWSNSYIDATAGQNGVASIQYYA